MRVLVTGGIGAIGKNVARKFVDEGHTVVLFDRAPLQSDCRILGGLGDKVLVEVGTVADGQSVYDVIIKNKVESIVHLAGMLPPHQNNLRPVEALNVNIIGSANVLEAARVLELGPVIMASAAGVMGRPEDLQTPRKEEDVKLPLAGIYPLSKLAVEQLVYTYRQLFKVNTTAIRPRNVYGPGANPRIQPLFEMFFAALDGQDFVRETGGDSIFDYTYVKDIAKGIFDLHQMDGTPPGYIYNISRGKGVNMAEVAAAMQKLFPDQKIEVGPGPWKGVVEGGKEFELTVHPAVMPPQDVSKARNDFGYNPEWDIERGLADWVRWYRTGEYR